MGPWSPGSSFLPFSKMGIVFPFPHRFLTSHKKKENNRFGKFFYLQHRNIEEESYYYEEEPVLIPTIKSAPEPVLNTYNCIIKKSTLDAGHEFG